MVTNMFDYRESWRRDYRRGLVYVLVAFLLFSLVYVSGRLLLAPDSLPAGSDAGKILGGASGHGFAGKVDSGGSSAQRDLIGGGKGDSDAYQGAIPVDMAGDATTLLTPGSSAPLDVIFVNSSAVPITLDDVHVTISSVDAPNESDQYPCSASDYSVVQGPSPLEVIVPAASSTSLSKLGIPVDSWPLITMIDAGWNQSGCQGATVRVAYSSSGAAS